MRFLREIFSLAIMASALLVSSCDNDNLQNEAKEHNRAVTYYTIDGVWQLAEWNDAPLAEGTCLYLKLDRKEHRFEMWDNLNSMYTIMRSGSFLLSIDDMHQDIISGWYDYGIGDWASDYAVELNNEGDKMLWRAVDSREKMLFVEIDELPKF